MGWVFFILGENPRIKFLLLPQMHLVNSQKERKKGMHWPYNCSRWLATAFVGENKPYEVFEDFFVVRRNLCITTDCELWSFCRCLPNMSNYYSYYDINERKLLCSCIDTYCVEFRKYSLFWSFVWNMNKNKNTPNYRYSHQALVNMISN